MSGPRPWQVMMYRDREHAGQVLGELLSGYADRPDVRVLGLVRGGVPVADQVARALRVPLDVLVVRKLGVPWASELAFGALGPAGVRVLNPEVAGGLSEREIAEVTERERVELDRRQARYRGGRPPLDLTGLVAIVVDDGLATGATARAAVEVTRGLAAAHVVLAAPVASPQAVSWLKDSADEVVCPLTPAGFGAVSRYFDEFGQVSDATVIEILSR